MVWRPVAAIDPDSERAFLLGQIPDIASGRYTTILHQRRQRAAQRRIARHVAETAHAPARHHQGGPGMRLEANLVLAGFQQPAGRAGRRADRHAQPGRRRPPAGRPQQLLRAARKPALAPEPGSGCAQALPDPEHPAHEKALAAHRAGFRLKYLVHLAALFTEIHLDRAHGRRAEAAAGSGGLPRGANFLTCRATVSAIAQAGLRGHRAGKTPICTSPCCSCATSCSTPTA